MTNQNKTSTNHDPKLFTSPRGWKRRIILSVIVSRYDHLIKTTPATRKRHVYGDFIKLTNLLEDPLTFITPRVSTKKILGGTSTRLHIEKLNIPKYKYLDLQQFYTEWFHLLNKALDANKSQMQKACELFIKKLWQSDLFEDNPHQTPRLEFYENFIKNDLFDEEFRNLSYKKEKEMYIREKLKKIPYLDEIISKQLRTVIDHPRKLKKTFQDFHNDLRNDFELFAVIIGLIRVASDLINHTEEPDLHTYFDKSYHVCYGVKNFKMFKKKSKTGARPLVETLSAEYNTLNHFLDTFICGTLRIIRNAESHEKSFLRQDKLSEKIFIIENKRDNFREEFTLGEIWKIHESAYLLMTYFFNLFFYLLPNEQILLAMNTLLNLQRFDPGFGPDDDI